MRLTSRRDMVAGATLAGAGLMFQLGAIFGPPPPSGYLQVPPLDMARTSQASSPAVDTAPPVVVAAFLDRPASIGEVAVGGDKADARIKLRLGPGRVDPTFSWTRRDGVSVLKVGGLGVDQAALGPGGGLVDRWSVAPTEAAVFSLKTPARIDRVFLDDTSGPERDLVLELKACPVA